MHGDEDKKDRTNVKWHIIPFVHMCNYVRLEREGERERIRLNVCACARVLKVLNKDRNSTHLLTPAAPIMAETKYNGLHDNPGAHRLRAASEK